MPAPPTPKDRFTSLDTLALVRELRLLGPVRVDKAFDLADHGWSLVLHGSSIGRRELLLVPGRYGALLDPGQSHATVLSPIAKELRRLLAGAAIREVSEPGGERYLEIAFSRPDIPEGLVLAVEFFGAGNLVVARGGRIATVARPRGWAHRTVRVGAAYARPPVRTDPWRLTVAQISAELARSRTDLASTLAARLALGGPVAEEVVARGGWDGTQPAAPLADRLAPDLHAALSALVTEIGERPRGHLYRRGGELVDATAYESRRWTGASDEEVRPTFSAAAVEFFRSVVPSPPSEAETAAARDRAALERLAERQRRAVVELESNVRDRRDEADTVLAHFTEVEAALARGKDRARDPGGEEVTVELGGRPVVLRTDRTPRSTAQALYRQSKQLAAKLEGVRAALRETEAQLSGPREPPRSRTPRTEAPPAKRLWFERFRWFISSEGAVVIGGRDAPSNDLLVRRHLKEGDVYVHADLHGAASVVVKRPADGTAVGEATLREAAQWAAALSKAWRAGLAAATAFWVTPDQVSKAAAAGEFVPRGAFVIHGTKHFVRDVPLELALGTIQYEGSERWTVAPEPAVRARGQVRALVTPGEERDRPRLESELSRDLGIPRSLLQGLLPAGGLAVRRT